MIARAVRPGRERAASRFAVAALALIFASPAAAQLGGTISLASDDVFRGYSVSNGDPVALLDLSYDNPSGAYAGASGAMVVAGNEGVRPLRIQLNAGYAKRVAPGLTLDVGATGTSYSHYSGLRSGRSYAELYLGVAGESVASRLSVSPDYLGSGAAAYAEVNAKLASVASFDITGHAGALVPLGSYRSPTRFDWQIGAGRTFGRIAVRASLSGAAPARDSSRRYGRYHRGAVVLAVSYIL